MGSAAKTKVAEDYAKAPINSKLAAEEKLKLLRELPAAKPQPALGR